MNGDDTAYAYTYAEVGRRLGVSHMTVRRMVKAGELPVIAVWGRTRITHRALAAYLADRERHLIALAPRRHPAEAGREIGRPMG